MYTDRSTWQAAAAESYKLSIDDDLNSGNVDRGSYVFGGTANATFPNANAQTTVDGSGYYASWLDAGSDPIKTTTIQFDETIYALGYSINPFSGNVGASIAATFDGGNQQIFSLPSSDVTGFIGFINTSGFTDYEISSVSGGARHGIDNLSAFTAVPEWTHTSLLCGWILMGYTAFRKKAKSS